MNRSRVVLVLSGGGARAGAHLGAFRAMAGLGIRPAQYVATSMGAVMAAMLAAGVSAEEALDQVSALRDRDVVRADRLSFLKGLWARKILEEAPLRDAMHRLVPFERFADLKIPLTVVATEVESGARVCFGHGGEDVPLQDALYATCALPVYYPPATINGREYVDGGLRTVLPLEVAAAFQPSVVIAVDVGAGFDETPRTQPASLPPVVEAHGNAVRILMAEQTSQALALWRATPGRPPLVYIRPPAERGATFRVDQMRRYAQEGYEAAIKALADLPTS